MGPASNRDLAREGGPSSRTANRHRDRSRFELQFVRYAPLIFLRTFFRRADMCWFGPRRAHQTSSRIVKRSAGQLQLLPAFRVLPNYCADHPSDHSSECRAGAGKGFVLHGLWPQADTEPYLVNCGTASPVSSDIVNHMLNYMPSASLIQHEWQTHGTCSGLSAQDYFDKVLQAFGNLQMPRAYQQINAQQEPAVQDLEQAFTSANSAPAGAFRVSCHSGELVNLEACLTKDLKYQSCGNSVRECPSNQVLMRPVK